LNNGKGKWVTVHGRRIFLKEGFKVIYGADGAYNITSEAEVTIDSNTLDVKYNKHAAEFGNPPPTKSEFKQMALDFANRTDTETMSFKTGEVSKYDSNTNEFIKLKKDNSVITYFKPTSPHYWSTQQSKYKNEVII